VRKGRPNDPQRRARILQAALAVIADGGVQALSYRRVAARAGVPLGSMTYYFADFETLIVAAFETLRSGLEPRYAAPMRNARDDTEAVEALVAATCGATSPSREDIRLYLEMYQYAARSPQVAELLRDFQEESLVILRGRFSDGAARAVDALMWGWWIYRSLHPAPLEEDLVRRAYRSLASEFASGPTARPEDPDV
jgi:DNA-binding transcriptional regulator YbjK